MATSRVDYEARFALALKRIVSYMTPNQLRRQCERAYGLEYEEALEMAYENVRSEAQAALKGYRPRKKYEAPPLTDAQLDAVDSKYDAEEAEAEETGRQSE